MDTLITGNGYIASCLKLEADRLSHQECNLSDWGSVRRVKWEGDTIIHCAHEGHYGYDIEGSVERNIAMFVNLRRRWPKAHLITFGSGAMHDKSKPIVNAGEYDYANPKDLYGLSKRLTVDLADVTLIPFGVYGNSGFVKSVRENLDNVIIYQDAMYSWFEEDKLTDAVKWSMTQKGRFNLISFNMTLTDVALKEGAKNITYLKSGMANEYTGRKND